MRLTESKIAAITLEPGRKDKLVFDDAQRGLAVRVTASGGRTYLAQYARAGRRHRVPLGAVSAMSLEAGREAAAVVMGDVAKGSSPAEERNRETAELKA